ncbi:MAG: hypothetical protein LBS52_02175 [Dysgonamonadaceae bacterium]|nr:hypothetical protein [Dysgonamonadaceae bacterium]
MSRRNKICITAGKRSATCGQNAPSAPTPKRVEPDGCYPLRGGVGKMTYRKLRLRLAHGYADYALTGEGQNQ